MSGHYSMEEGEIAPSSEGEPPIVDPTILTLGLSQYSRREQNSSEVNNRNFSFDINFDHYPTDNTNTNRESCFPVTSLPQGMQRSYTREPSVLHDFFRTAPERTDPILTNEDHDPDQIQSGQIQSGTIQIISEINNPSLNLNSDHYPNFNPAHESGPNQSGQILSGTRSISELHNPSSSNSNLYPAHYQNPNTNFDQYFGSNLPNPNLKHSQYHNLNIDHYASVNQVYHSNLQQNQNPNLSDLNYTNYPAHNPMSNPNQNPNINPDHHSSLTPNQNPNINPDRHSSLNPAHNPNPNLNQNPRPIPNQFTNRDEHGDTVRNFLSQHSNPPQCSNQPKATQRSRLPSPPPRQVPPLVQRMTTALENIQTIFLSTEQVVVPDDSSFPGATKVVLKQLMKPRDGGSTSNGSRWTYLGRRLTITYGDYHQVFENVHPDKARRILTSIREPWRSVKANSTKMRANSAQVPDTELMLNVGPPGVINVDARGNSREASPVPRPGPSHSGTKRNISEVTDSAQSHNNNPNATVRSRLPTPPPRQRPPFVQTMETSLKYLQSYLESSEPAFVPDGSSYPGTKVVLKPVVKHHDGGSTSNSSQNTCAGRPLTITYGDMDFGYENILSNKVCEILGMVAEDDTKQKSSVGPSTKEASPARTKTDGDQNVDQSEAQQQSRPSDEAAIQVDNMAEDQNVDQTLQSSPTKSGNGKVGDQTKGGKHC